MTIDSNLDAIALVQAVRASRNGRNDLALQNWLRTPRARLDVYTVAILLARVVAVNTESDDLDEFAITIAGLQAED